MGKDQREGTRLQRTPAPRMLRYAATGGIVGAAAGWLAGEQISRVGAAEIERKLKENATPAAVEEDVRRSIRERDDAAFPGLPRFESLEPRANASRAIGIIGNEIKSYQKEPLTADQIRQLADLEKLIVDVHRDHQEINNKVEELLMPLATNSARISEISDDRAGDAKRQQRFLEQESTAYKIMGAVVLGAISAVLVASAGARRDDRQPGFR